MFCCCLEQLTDYISVKEIYARNFRKLFNIMEANFFGQIIISSISNVVLVHVQFLKFEFTAELLTTALNF